MANCLVCGIRIPEWYPVQLCDVCGGLKTTPLSGEDLEIMKKNFKSPETTNNFSEGLSSKIEKFLQTPYTYETHLKVLEAISNMLCTGKTIYLSEEFVGDSDVLDDVGDMNDLYDVDDSDEDMDDFSESSLFDPYFDELDDSQSIWETGDSTKEFIITLEDILDLSIARLSKTFKWVDIRNN